MYVSMEDEFDMMRESIEDMYAHAQKRYEASGDDLRSAKLLQIMDDINAFEHKYEEWSREVMR